MVSKHCRKSITSKCSRKYIFSVAMGSFAALILMIGIGMIIDHRDSVNNALDTGECLADGEFHNLIDKLKHLLRISYRLIFKACG